MSKLPNAPLVDVIFELQWSSINPDDLNKFEMCLGTVFSDLQQDFSKIIHFRPDTQIPLVIFNDNPTHRFTSGDGLAKNSFNYPIYQLGPGLLTVNTIDEKYEKNI